MPTSGVAKVEGADVARDPVTVKRRIRVVPQVNNLDRSLTAKEILLFHAEYFGVPKQQREQHAGELLAPMIFFGCAYYPLGDAARDSVVPVRRAD